MAQEQGGVKEIDRVRMKEPEMYRVRFHNDDFTPMDFVVMVLCVVFFKSETEAEKLMLDVHNNDSAIVGTYPLDIALSKAKKTHIMAINNGYPLKVTVEPE